MLNPELCHRHLIVRANIENSLSKDDEADIWFRRLVDNIGMKLMMGPYSVYHNDEGNRGRTVLLGLSTSSITGHIWDEISPCIINLDVYSCKDFDIRIVFDMLSELGSSNIRYKFIDRDNQLVEVANGNF
jgi:hypothetical protein